MINGSIKIDYKQALDLLDKAESPALKQKMAERVADDVVLPALRKSNYPNASGKKMQWASEKARRYFFAAILPSGGFPYQRSGRTGDSYMKQAIPDGVTVKSGLASAAYTRGPGQAAYHRGNWETYEELAQRLEPAAEVAATAVIVEELTNP